LHLSFRDAELSCQEANQLAVGLAIERGSGQPDLEALAMGTIQRVRA